MITWPPELISDIAARRSVLFLGAGVSKNASNAVGERPKDWIEFLQSLAALIPAGPIRDEVDACIAESDLLSACELARHILHADVFKSHLLAEFVNRRFTPAKIHKDLSRVDSRFVLTPNFDKLYETSANNEQEGTILVKNYYDTDVADVFRRRERVVLKIHGTIDTPGQTIFTRSDYAKAREVHANFYRLLDALFVTHTVVFIGTSMRDPDLQLLLEGIRYRFEGSRPHFAVMPADSTKVETVRMMERTMNIRVLQYDPANYHAELANSIADLVTLVEDERAQLITTADW